MALRIKCIILVFGFISLTAISVFAENDLRTSIIEADEALANGKFREAFLLYQKIIENDEFRFYSPSQLISVNVKDYCNNKIKEMFNEIKDVYKDQLEIKAKDLFVKAVKNQSLELFNELSKKYAFTNYAKFALFKIAVYYFDSGDFRTALNYFKSSELAEAGNYMKLCEKYIAEEETYDNTRCFQPVISLNYSENNILLERSKSLSKGRYLFVVVKEDDSYYACKYLVENNSALLLWKCKINNEGENYNLGEIRLNSSAGILLVYSKLFIFAIDSMSGELKWTYNTAMISSLINIDEDMPVFIKNNGNMFLCHGYSVYAVDIISGNILWTYNTAPEYEETPWTLESYYPQIFSEDNECVYFASFKGTGAIDKNQGTLAWFHENISKQIKNYYISCVSSKFIIIADKNKLKILDKSNKNVLKEFELDFKFIYLLQEEADKIYLASDNSVIAIDAIKGDILWNNKFSSAGSSRKSNFAFDDKTIFASAKSSLYCISKENGKLLEKLDLNDNIVNLDFNEGLLSVKSNSNIMLLNDFSYFNNELQKSNLLIKKQNDLFFQAGVKSRIFELLQNAANTFDLKNDLSNAQKYFNDALKLDVSTSRNRDALIGLLKSRINALDQSGALESFSKLENLIKLFEDEKEHKESIDTCLSLIKAIKDKRNDFFVKSMLMLKNTYKKAGHFSQANAVNSYLKNNYSDKKLVFEGKETKISDLPDSEFKQEKKQAPVYSHKWRIQSLNSNFLILSEEGKKIFCLDGTGDVNILDAENGKILSRIQITGSTIKRIAYSDEFDILCVFTNKGEILFANPQNNTVYGKIDFKEKDNFIDHLINGSMQRPNPLFAIYEDKLAAGGLLSFAVYDIFTGELAWEKNQKYDPSGKEMVTIDKYKKESDIIYVSYRTKLSQYNFKNGEEKIIIDKTSSPYQITDFVITNETFYCVTYNQMTAFDMQKKTELWKAEIRNFSQRSRLFIYDDTIEMISNGMIEGYSLKDRKKMWVRKTANSAETSNSSSVCVLDNLIYFVNPGFTLQIMDLKGEVIWAEENAPSIKLKYKDEYSNISIAIGKKSLVIARKNYIDFFTKD